MSLLLVDDRDGRVVAELETLDEAVAVMEHLARDPETDHLCLVELRHASGALAGYDSSTTVRVLS
jgi:hypothetical protein